MAKVDPYLRPLYDALYDMIDPEKVTGYSSAGMIEVAPLAFMRGRTLNDCFIILDEAQNTTPEQMKMFLTRLGFGSKMVVTGDITQVDLPREQQLRAGRRLRDPRGHRRHRLRPLRRRRRRAPQARAADRRGLRRARAPRPDPAARASCWRLRSWATAAIAPAEVERLVAIALASANVEDGHVAVDFVDADRIRDLNRDHRGKDVPTDVLSFPIDEEEDLHGPRELGDW